MNSHLINEVITFTAGHYALAARDLAGNCADNTTHSCRHPEVVNVSGAHVAAEEFLQSTNDGFSEQYS